MSSTMLEHVPVGYFLLDEAGHIEDVNGLGASLVSRTVDELVDSRFADLVAPNDTWRFLKHLRDASRSLERQTCRLALRGEGDERLTHLFTYAERSASGSLLRFHMAALTVAAELIEAKEEAEKISHLKTAFLANMSHEIRTPLTGIIGFATVLAKELPEEHREFAELIRGSGRRLLEMLNSVLDLAKLESDEMRLRHDDVDLAVEVRKAVDLLKPVAAEKELSMQIKELDDGPFGMRVDRAAVNRILHNLIGNAIKFTDQGQIVVEVWSDDSDAGFDVIDTGIGVDAKFVPQLFDEFSQESSGMNRSHSGAGLGLAITKRLIDLMDGRIEVDTEKDGGSRFRVRLPKGLEGAPDADEAPDERRGTEADPPNGFRVPVRLLLVEDHGDTQQLLVELLEEQYSVSVAATASEAFLLACQKQFDMILMDIDLGEGPDGTELLQQLRALPEYEGTPIVAVTAYALPGDRERFLEMGFTAYVGKPFDVDELIKLPMELG